jgi:hypothetical protein
MLSHQKVPLVVPGFLTLYYLKDKLYKLFILNMYNVETDIHHPLEEHLFKRRQDCGDTDI